MGLSLTLLRWRLRQLYWLNRLTLVASGAYALLAPQPLWITQFPWWFVVGHAALIAWILGRTQTPAAAFLHAQCYSRDCLWRHTLLAAGIAGGMLWMPLAVCVWTPLRASLQDALGNPHFPYMAPTEAPTVWAVLALDALLLPIYLAAGARWAHPARGNAAGVLLAFGATCAAVSVGTTHWFTLGPRPPYGALAGVAAIGALLSVGSLFVGRRLFREVEVHP